MQGAGRNHLLFRVRRRAGFIDPRSVLGVSYTATRAEIKQAFREKIRKAHPDAGGSAELFQQVHWAYKSLLDSSDTGSSLPPGTQVVDLGTVYGNPPPRSEGAAAGSGWTVNDFYKWRREQVQERNEKFEQDADFRSPHQRWERYHWPGTDKRRQQEEAHRRAVREEQEQEEADLQERLRRDLNRREAQGQAQRQQRQQRRPRGRSSNLHDRDLGNSEWAQYIRDARQSKEEGAEPRSGAGAEAEVNTDRVVSYRPMTTPRGRVKVPVYESEDGELYYHSPLSSKRVVMKR